MSKILPSECSDLETTNIDWGRVIGDEKQSPHFVSAMSYVEQRRNQGITIYPPKPDIFNAFKLTPFSSLRVVIIGQDPYHGPNQAHGLCFSVQKGIPLPPSLKNIYQEISTDLDVTMPSHGNLSDWAKQGVLLLNTVLTVEAGQANSHKTIGWELFTDRVISEISHHKTHVVFLLWGSHAQKKTELIDKNKHSILAAPHPSPLSAHRGFFGCRHFSKCNQALLKHNQAEIDWHISV